MSFKELFGFAQSLEPKISRKAIREKVICLTGKSQVRHIRSTLDVSVCRGFFLSSKNQDARLVRQVGGTAIVTARGLNDCWERFVFVKELMHLFEDPEKATDSGAKFDTLLNEFAQPSRDPSAPMQSEIECFWMAVSVLCPQKSRAEYREKLAERQIDHMGIATDLKIPAMYVPRLFEPRYDTFLAEFNLN